MSYLKSLLSGILAIVLLLASGLAAAVPEIQHWRTANGVPVYFIPARELPMVDAQILFNAGSVRDGERPGLAKLTNALLEEGAGDWSADAIADRLDRVGARFSASSRRDSATIALRSLVDPRYLQPTVETVARLLKEPTFAPDAVERVRQQMLTALRERAQSPGAIAQDAFYKALYDKHPYGSPPEGTPASLNAMTRAEIQDFHRRHYTAVNAVVALVGDLDRPAAEQLANALVAGLPQGEPISPPPPVPPVTASQTIRIPHPSSQSHVLIGQLGVSRADPDYYALYLGNHVLGGNGLVSQLSQEIREKRGRVYGANSGFSPMRQAGPFLLNLQTRNASVAVQSLDDAALGASGNVLVSIGTRSLPQQGNRAPFAVEPLAGSIAVKAPAGLTAWRNGPFNQWIALPAAYQDGSYQIELDGKLPVQWIALHRAG